MPTPMRMRRIVGRDPPGSGIGSASIVVGVAVDVASRVIVAEGVASPKTCEPDFRMVNAVVRATGLPVLSVVVIVTLCFPLARALFGVKDHNPFPPTVVFPVVGFEIPMVTVTVFPETPVPWIRGRVETRDAFGRGDVIMTPPIF